MTFRGGERIPFRLPRARVAKAPTLDLIAVAERMASPVVLLDVTGVIRYANPAAGRLVGRPAPALAGVGVLSLVHPDDWSRARHDLAEVMAGRARGEAIEYRVGTADGSWRTVAALASDLSDLCPASGLFVSATDVTEQRTHEESLRRLLETNPVTQLPNRRALEERLGATRGERVSIAFLDVDHFKRVNESLGYTAGDAVLRAMGARLEELLPEGCMLVHFAADTFAVLVAGMEHRRVVLLVQELVQSIARPLPVGSRELRLTASAGVAFWEGTATIESLLRDADAALTHAKRRGQGRVEVFSDAMRSVVAERLAIETDLRQAVDRGDFALHLQPVVRLATGAEEGAEALLRWTRPDGAHVEPSGFIPVAEETGLIVSLGQWVLDAALEAVRAGRASRLSINMSPRELLDPTLCQRIERSLARSGLRPEVLAFEVTEAVLVENFDEASSCLNRMRRLGCTVGLDDFGSGYSSLSYLRRLPVDFLKLDRALVADIDVDRQAAQIAATIVTLARTLSLTTVAEGIERAGQADLLRAFGCDYGQGWLFGRPRPA